MNATGKLIVLAFAMVLLDLPWLTFIGGDYNAAIEKIQGGRNVRMRPIAGVIVYPALAYLALKPMSLKEAFLMGACVYAVYDFTVLAVFKDYPLYLAVGDTIWGGLLFSAVFFLRDKFKL
jgi:uncharacterized membrane protein